MTSLGRQICKLAICCAVFGFTLVLLAELCLPLILDYIWPVPNSSAKGLESIIAHRIELRDLEAELDQVLTATNNPLNEYVINSKNEIVAESDNYFSAVEAYTKEYGKLNEEDIKGFIKTRKLIMNKSNDFIAKFEKLYGERRVALNTIAERVLDVGEYSKSAWILKKNMDIMAGAGFVLDYDQEEVEDDEENPKKVGANQNSSLKDMKEDDTCFAILQQLLNVINKVDALTERTILKVDQLSAQLTEEEFGGNNTDLVREFKLDSELFKSEIDNLLKNKRKLIGKTSSFISAATARVNTLLNNVVKKERDSKEEMIQAIKKMNEKVVRGNYILDKLTVNMNLRNAHDLDREASQDEL